MTTWAVCWTWRGARHLIDVDDEREAAMLGALLAESGREEVVILWSGWEPPADVAQRVRERIEARLRAAGVP